MSPHVDFLNDQWVYAWVLLPNIVRFLSLVATIVSSTNTRAYKRWKWKKNERERETENVLQNATSNINCWENEKNNKTRRERKSKIITANVSYQWYPFNTLCVLFIRNLHLQNGFSSWVWVWLIVSIKGRIDCDTQSKRLFDWRCNGKKQAVSNIIWIVYWLQARIRIRKATWLFVWNKNEHSVWMSCVFVCLQKLMLDIN